MDSVAKEELIRLYAPAKHLLSLPLKNLLALHLSKPWRLEAVVGIREGGCLETIVDGSTGLLVKPDVSEIINAIKIISRDPSIYKEKCLEQADRFNVEIFLKNMKQRSKTL